MEGFPGEWPQNFAGDKIAFATQALYKKIRFRCFVVWEKKSVQDLGRIKRKTNEKKEKKLIAAKSELVVMKR